MTIDKRKEEIYHLDNNNGLINIEDMRISLNQTDIFNILSSFIKLNELLKNDKIILNEDETITMNLPFYTGKKFIFLKCYINILYHCDLFKISIVNQYDRSYQINVVKSYFDIIIPILKICVATKYNILFDSINHFMTFFKINDKDEFINCIKSNLAYQMNLDNDNKMDYILLSFNCNDNSSILINVIDTLANQYLYRSNPIYFKQE